jgi:hypothetical protein
MFAFLRKFFVVNVALILALLGSGITPAIVHAQTPILPNMLVTLVSGNSTYSSTVYAQRPLTFQAYIKNTGNVPLQAVANLTVPSGWQVDEDVYSDCPDQLASGNTCIVTWKFTPLISGQIYLRVYARGYYTEASGSTNRITRSPAFIFNVQPPKGSGGGTSSSGGTSSGGTSTSSNGYPNMSVALIANDTTTYAATIYAGKPLIFRAKITNTGGVPLNVTANLNVPAGWDVDEDMYNDCELGELTSGNTCTVTWKFTPQVSGQVYLWVYLRGNYTDAAGVANRITRTPLFIFNVQPPKVSD